jgi:hypothetical protein
MARTGAWAMESDAEVRWLLGSAKISRFINNHTWSAVIGYLPRPLHSPVPILLSPQGASHLAHDRSGGPEGRAACCSVSVA